TSPLPMKVLQVIGGLDVRYGGPPHFLPRLCAGLARGGAGPVLFCVADPGAAGGGFGTRGGHTPNSHRGGFAGAPVLSKLRFSTEFDGALRGAAPEMQVAHNHGLWMMPNVTIAHAARRAQVPFILSPRGMLAPEALAFSRLQKQAFWYLLQKRA